MGKTIVRFREDELVSQLKRNDRSAFEYLYDHYSPALYGIILKIVKDEERAADVLQDSFLKIWRNIDKYWPEKGTLFTWMLNVARNTAIDKHRTETKVQNVVSLEVAAEREINLSDDWHRRLYDMDVRAMVALLLPERRLLIELVYFEGYTHEELSEKLQLPLGTVKSRIRRALQELRDIFMVRESTIKVA